MSGKMQLGEIAASVGAQVASADAQLQEGPEPDAARRARVAPAGRGGGAGRCGRARLRGGGRGQRGGSALRRRWGQRRRRGAGGGTRRARLHARAGEAQAAGRGAGRGDDRHERRGRPRERAATGGRRPGALRHARAAQCCDEPWRSPGRRGIVAAYRLLLGREPEPTLDLDAATALYPDVETLQSQMLASAEAGSTLFDALGGRLGGTWVRRPTSFGRQIHLCLSDVAVSKTILLTGDWEPAVGRQILALLEPGDTFPRRRGERRLVLAARRRPVRASGERARLRGGGQPDARGPPRRVDRRQRTVGVRHAQAVRDLRSCRAGRAERE